MTAATQLGVQGDQLAQLVRQRGGALEIAVGEPLLEGSRGGLEKASARSRDRRRRARRSSFVGHIRACGGREHQGDADLHAQATQRLRRRTGSRQRGPPQLYRPRRGRSLNPEWGETRPEGRITAKCGLLSRAGRACPRRAPPAATPTSRPGGRRAAPGSRPPRGSCRECLVTGGGLGSAQRGEHAVTARREVEEVGRGVAADGAREREAVHDLAVVAGSTTVTSFWVRSPHQR